MYQYNFFDVLLRKLCYLMRSRLIFVCLYWKEYIYVYFDLKNMVIIKLFIFYETTEIKSIKQDEF